MTTRTAEQPWTREQLIALARRVLHDAIRNGHAEGAAHKARELMRLVLLASPSASTEQK